MRALIVVARGREPRPSGVSLFFWPTRASSLHEGSTVNGSVASLLLLIQPCGTTLGPGPSRVAATAASPYMRSGPLGPAP